MTRIRMVSIKGTYQHILPISPIPSPPARASTSCPRPGPLREANLPRSPSFWWCSTTSFWMATWRRIVLTLSIWICLKIWIVQNSFIIISTNTNSISIGAITKSGLFWSNSCHISYGFPPIPPSPPSPPSAQEVVVGRMAIEGITRGDLLHRAASCFDGAGRHLGPLLSGVIKHLNGKSPNKIEF